MRRLTSKPLQSATSDSNSASRLAALVALSVGGLLVAAVMIWQAFSQGGNPDPLAPHLGFNAAVLDIGVLVFREGLECILVLAAITATMGASSDDYRRPVAVGAGTAFIATLVTWWIAIGLIDDLTQKVSALNLQAATGLLAIVVLLVVMNWFFHKVYWTGWISLHTKKKYHLLDRAKTTEASGRIWWGCWGLPRSIARALKSSCSCRAIASSAVAESCCTESCWACCFLALLPY